MRHLVIEAAEHLVYEHMFTIQPEESQLRLVDTHIFRKRKDHLHLFPIVA